MQDNKIAAGFGVRAAAYIIDRVIVLLPLLLFVRLPAWLSAFSTGGTFTAKDFFFHYSALDILCYLLSSAYFVLLTYCSGSTLGKKAMRLRVENQDGEPMRFVDVLYRETVGRFLSRILYIGYIMILVDRQNRSFHDWLCDSRVVYDEGVVFRPRPRRAGEPEASDFSREKAPSGYGYSIPGAYMAEPPLPLPEETEEEPADAPIKGLTAEPAEEPTDDPDEEDEDYE